MLLAGDSGIACSRSHGETVAVDEVTFSVGKGSNATMNAMWTWASGMQDIVQDQPEPMSSSGLAVVLCAAPRARTPGTVRAVSVGLASSTACLALRGRPVFCRPDPRSLLLARSCYGCGLLFIITSQSVFL